jgi:hypothetical protein
MVQVTLPLGYPQLSGEVDNILIFQGTMARLYTVPKDPRTDSQMFERRFLSDIAKMRASAREWAKGLFKIAFGKKWTSVIYQMVKGDVYGFWSARLAEWEEFDEETKAYLAGEAPFTVTFNDPGMIWWGLYGTIYDWGVEKGIDWWSMPVPNSVSIDDMMDWWLAGLDNAEYWGGLFNGGDYEETALLYTGDWYNVTSGGSSGGAHYRADESDAEIRFVFVGRYALLDITGYVFDLFLDGSIAPMHFADVDGLLLGPYTYGVHYAVLRFNDGFHEPNYATIDRVRIRRLKSEL